VEEATVEVGYRYRSPSIVLEDGDDGATCENPREPSARPGFRAPHATVRADGKELSTLDLFGRDFVLIAGASGQDWCDAATAAGAASGVAVRTYRLGEDLTSESPLADLLGIGDAGAVLVRPDGFVAWRAADAGPSSSPTLGGALEHALGR
jgi:aklavinone 12-hydroxylase